MNKRNNRHIGIPGLLLAAAAVIGLWVIWPRQGDSPTFPPATRITGTENAIPNLSFWRSDHELVCFYQNQIGTCRTASFETTTGFSTSSMSSLISNSIIPDFNSINQIHVSPDGHWILWPGHAGADHHLAWIASTLDGRQQREWPRRDIRYNHIFQWTQDSRHWVEIRDKTIENYGSEVRSAHVKRTCAVIHSVDTRNETVLPVNLPIEVCGGLWCLASGQFIVTDGSKHHFYDFNATTHVAREFSVTIPERTDVNDLALSPRGDRIAWVLTTLQPTKPDNMLNAIHFLFRPTASYAYSLCESDGNGNHFHQLYPEVAQVDFPNYLHWTPDGKRIGFWYKKSLWTVSAN
jgi:hypothetical protein